MSYILPLWRLQFTNQFLLHPQRDKSSVSYLLVVYARNERLKVLNNNPRHLRYINIQNISHLGPKRTLQTSRNQSGKSFLRTQLQFLRRQFVLTKIDLFLRRQICSYEDRFVLTKIIDLTKIIFASTKSDSANEFKVISSRFQIRPSSSIFPKTND